MKARCAAAGFDDVSRRTSMAWRDSRGCQRSGQTCLQPAIILLDLGGAACTDHIYLVQERVVHAHGSFDSATCIETNKKATRDLADTHGDMLLHDVRSIR